MKMNLQDIGQGIEWRYNIQYLTGTTAYNDANIDYESSKDNEKV